MSLAYFPMYPDDFEADTAHLTLAEDGAYNRLLRLCWRTPGCSVPADRQWIYRRLRAATDEDKAVVDAVIDEFFVLVEGRLSNARLRKEWLAAKAAHERRKNAGSKGGKNKSLKTNETPSSNAVAKPKQPEPEPEPEPSISRARATAADADRGSSSSPTDRERLLSAMGADPRSGTMGPNGRVLGRQRDMAEAERWSADLQLSTERQCAVIREVMARQGPHFVPNSFRYFSPAMAEVAKGRSRRQGQEPQSDDLSAKMERWRKIAAKYDETGTG